MNKNNLQKMYDHIFQIPSRKLNMKGYRGNLKSLSQIECKSVGCVIGHSVVLAPHLIRFDEDGTIDFQNWSYEFLEFYDYNLWEFMFGGDWADSKKTNSKLQILARLKYVLKHGTYPKEFKKLWFQLVLETDIVLPEELTLSQKIKKEFHEFNKSKKGI